jgi:hypothetical protein
MGEADRLLQAIVDKAAARRMVIQLAVERADLERLVAFAADAVGPRLM